MAGEKTKKIPKTFRQGPELTQKSDEALPFPLPLPLHPTPSLLRVLESPIILTSLSLFVGSILSAPNCSDENHTHTHKTKIQQVK